MKSIFTFIALFTTSLLNAQTIWNAGSYTFTKTSTSQFDCITTNVCLSRGSVGVLYNTITQTAGQGNCNSNPSNTEWAYGSIANWNTLTYQNLYALNGCNPPSMVNQPMVLHLILDNVYLQLTFSYWQSGPNGGNFTYTRSVGVITGVKLVSFEAIKENNNSILLNWETASEENSKGFYLQRSTNGKDFENLIFISSKGNSSEETSYKYVDSKPLIGINYYRLLQLDYNGSSEYSKTVSQKIIGEGIAVYPNPTSNYVMITDNQYANSYIRISNSVGKVVKELYVDNGKIDLSELSQGIYYLNIRAHSNNLTKMIFKQ